MLERHTLGSATEAVQNCLADLEDALESLQRGQTRQAKAAIVAACKKMRPHIFTLSPDIRVARENIDFFDRLASSCVRNTELIIALAVKLIGPGFMVQNIDRPLGREVHFQPSGDGKRVPIPPGFGAELRKAMENRGHGFEKACGDMDGIDPKTLRKMLKGQEAVHQQTLNKASKYIRETPKV